MSSKPSFIDPKYDGLDSKEVLRQVERDTMLWEQTEAQKEATNRLNVQIELENQRYAEEKRKEEMDKIFERIEEYNRIQKEKEILDAEIKSSLCSDLGVEDYNDFIEFKNWLNTMSKEEKNKYNDVITKYEDFFKTDEIKKLENTISSDEVQLEIEKTKLDKLEESNKLANEIEEDIYGNKIKKIKNETRHIKDSIVFAYIGIVIITLFCLSSLICYFNMETVIIWYFADIFLIIRLIYLKKKIKILKISVKEYNDKNEKITNSINELKDKIEDTKSKLELLMTAREKELKEDKKFNKLKEEYKVAINRLQKNETNNRREFNIFRKKHYNRTVEKKFKDLNLELEIILKNEIIGKGEIEDYTKFINEAILEQDEEENKITIEKEPLLEEVFNYIMETKNKTTVEPSVYNIQLEFDITHRRAENILKKYWECENEDE